MKVMYTLEARHDLAEIHAYITLQSPLSARSVIARIRGAAAMLGTFPRMGHAGTETGTQELGVKGLPHIIVYEIIRKRVVILDVFHGARER